MASERPLFPDGYPPAEIFDRLEEAAPLREMQGFADRFREANPAALARYARQWVPDPLHHWSRQWEYPYVYERLREELGERSAAAGGARILDAGSGLTFFPHFLAERLPLARVDCCDRDPLIEDDAALLLPPASAAVAYSTQDLSALRFPDATFDAVYCVSVLEHSDRREAIAAEFARVLKPGGLLVLTIDVSRDGRAEIPPEEAARLVAEVSARFDAAGEYGDAVRGGERGDVATTAHAYALDPTLLPWTPAGGEVLRRLLRPWSFPWVRAIRRVLRRSTGGPAYPDLTFFCMAWRRGGVAAEGGG